MTKKALKNMNTRDLSNLVCRELKNKVTEKMLDYELDRFVDMDEKKLLTRIKKFKNPIKAEACRQLAKSLRLLKIMRAARARRNVLFLERA